MRRREFITLLGGAVTWPLVARPQQATMPVIGFLGSATYRESSDFRLLPFRRGLNEIGYVEGRNVAIEYRWADDQYDRLSPLAADLVRRQVTVIAATGLNAALGAKAATTAIPIIFVVGVDPVAVGLVASLSRPGGNLTGVADLTGELGPKHLDLMHELVPTATIMAVLVNPTNPNAESLSRDFQTAARTLGLQLRVLHASGERDFDTVFATLVQLRAGALVIGTDAFLNSQWERLAALTARHAVPSIHPVPQFARAGGLMSYGGGLTIAYRQAGVYAGRILKGEKAADLPVVQATKVELVINLKTAKTLGLTFPITLLGRADEVIE
jgi:putative ABC transport system substrate-binding protein